MTEEYKTRRRIRVENFKKIAKDNLGEVKKYYENLYDLIDRYEQVANNENKQKIQDYIIEYSMERVISDTKILVQFNFDFASEYLHNLEVVQWLPMNLQRTHEPLKEVLEYDFDTNDLTNLTILKNRINSIINEIREYINKIESEQV